MKFLTIVVFALLVLMEVSAMFKSIDSENQRAHHDLERTSIISGKGDIMDTQNIE